MLKETDPRRVGTADNLADDFAKSIDRVTHQSHIYQIKGYGDGIPEPGPALPG